jgi:hypothetical protein
VPAGTTEWLDHYVATNLIHELSHSVGVAAYQTAWPNFCGKKLQVELIDRVIQALRAVNDDHAGLFSKTPEVYASELRPWTT